MSIQKIPFAAVQKVRQLIKDSLVLPSSEESPGSLSLSEDDEPPEPDSLYGLGDLFNLASTPEEEVHAPNREGRWFISATNPGAIVAKLPGLRIKSGFRMVSYLVRTAEGGSSVTWALPEALTTTAQLEDALNAVSDASGNPQPVGALSPMEAIEGDRTVPSFITASLLYRELQEFGTQGKNWNWRHHRLIESVPPQVPWEWRGEMPKDLATKVLVFPDGRAAVEFFSCRIVAPVAIVRHMDQYAANSYQPSCIDRVVAIPKRG